MISVYNVNSAYITSQMGYRHGALHPGASAEKCSLTCQHAPHGHMSIAHIRIGGSRR
jgi:hypothetical protein